MEPVLMLVTGVSLVLGAAMSVVAWKLLHHQRVHAAARIEALQAMSGDVDPADVMAAPAPDRRPDPAPRFATIDDEPIERAATPAATQAQVVVEPWDAIRERPGARPSRRPAEIPVRFASTDEPRAPGRRWAALAAVAGVMISVFVGVYALYSNDAPGAMSSAIGRMFTASASPATAEPLQLLSLKHDTDDSGTFVLTGLVQNPSSGRPLRGVVAVVYLFDRDGKYFAGGKTPLELASFHPGEESPFVVKVSGAAGVARYRVGFRLDDGGVVAHEDRRGQLPNGTVEDTGEDTTGAIAPPLPARSEG